MREVIVHPLPEITTEIREVDIPIPAPDQVVIRVVVAGSNVKDWLHITARNISCNSGDDIAGTVHALGDEAAKIEEFHVGDRVAAFHPMLSPHGAYAEYAVAPYHTVLHIPSSTLFEEAATIPLVSMTAAVSLYQLQGLPAPWFPRSSSAPEIPLIIYGASSSLGCFAIKLAKASNIHPIIAICGSSTHYVSTLLNSSRGDAIVDYRPGPDKMKEEVKKELSGREARHAVDCISANGTWIPLSQLLSPGGQVSVVSGANKYDDDEIPASVEIKYTYVGLAHSGAYLSNMPKQPVDKDSVSGAPDFAYVLFRWISMALGRGIFEGHPYKVIPGGLGGVETGLRDLKAGKNKGDKFVYRVAETEGLAGK